MFLRSKQLHCYILNSDPVWQLSTQSCLLQHKISKDRFLNKAAVHAGSAVYQLKRLSKAFPLIEVSLCRNAPVLNHSTFEHSQTQRPNS